MLEELHVQDEILIYSASAGTFKVASCSLRAQPEHNQHPSAFLPKRN